MTADGKRIVLPLPGDYDSFEPVRLITNRTGGLTQHASAGTQARQVKALRCLAPANTLKLTTFRIGLSFSGEDGQFESRSNYDWLFGSAIFCVP